MLSSQVLNHTIPSKMRRLLIGDHNKNTVSRGEASGSFQRTQVKGPIAMKSPCVDYGRLGMMLSDWQLLLPRDCAWAACADPSIITYSCILRAISPFSCF